MQAQNPNQPSLKDSLFLLAVVSMGGIIVLMAKYFNLSFGEAITRFTQIVGGLVAIGIAMAIFLSIRKHRMKRTPTNGPALKLGRYVDSKWWSEDLVLPLENMRHTLVTGVTGSGKSTFLRRFIQQVVRNERSFLYVDFKGEQEDFEAVVNICDRAGVKFMLQVFDISNPKTCATFNPLTLFKSLDQTVSFIMAVLFTEESNEYFKFEAERFIRMSLCLMDLSKTPRSLSTLEEIFYKPELRAALISKIRKLKTPTNEHEVDQAITYFEESFHKISEKDRIEKFGGMLSIISAFTSGEMRPIFNSANESTLNIEEAMFWGWPVIIRIPSGTYGELSERLVKAFSVALPMLVETRRTKGCKHDYFLIFDEGCSYMNESMIDLCKVAGSNNVNLLITRMADADLTNISPSFLGRMLSAINTHICFRTADPDTRDSLARLSMTVADRKLTERVSQGSSTGEASMREVQKFRIHPSQFGELNRGECFIIDPNLKIFRKAKIAQPEFV